MDASGTTQPSLEAWQGVPDTDAAGWSGKGRKGRSCECVCPGRYGPLPPQASPRRGAARRAADAAPDATRRYEGAFEGPALLARTPERRSRGPACGDATAQACVKPAGGVRIPLRGRIHRAGRDGNLLRPPRARALGSAWCRPATRRPHRRRPGPKSRGRTARDLISVSLESALAILHGDACLKQRCTDG